MTTEQQSQLTNEQKLAVVLVGVMQKTSSLQRTITFAQSKGLRYQIPNEDIVGLQLMADAGSVLASVYVMLKAMTATEQEVAQLTNNMMAVFKQQFPEIFTTATEQPADTSNLN